MIHIRCGDDICESLLEAGISGRFVRWADPLCQGPTPQGLPLSAWRETRARFIAARYGLTHRDALDYLVQQDEGLESALRAPEIVLWFEHDLFDQVILVFLLSWFSERGLLPGQLSLICIGSHPGVARFTGLGCLSPAELGGLLPHRRQVTPVQFEIARRAWRAFTSPNPLTLVAFLEQDLSPLPFLRPALRRHLAEFPSVVGGLAETARLALSVLRDGAQTGTRLFRAVQDRESAPWLGDSMFWPILLEHSGGAHPLVRRIGADGPAETLWSLTAAGAGALSGRFDHVAANGIDIWLGGVHLLGHDVPWRWDPGVGNLAVA